MRTIVIALCAFAAAPAAAEDAKPLPPALPFQQIRVDGWDLRLIPPGTAPDAGRIDPKPETPAVPQPLPALPHLKAPVCLETFTHRLRHVAAGKAAEELGRTLRQRHGIAAAGHGLVVESKVVIVPDPASNSLIIVTTPELAAEVHELIAEADAPPKQFVIKARVTQLGPDGQRRTVGTPMVRTVEGQPIAIMSAGPDGQGFELELLVEESPGAEAAAVKAASAEHVGAEPESTDWIEVTVPQRRTAGPVAPGEDG